MIFWFVNVGFYWMSCSCANTRDNFLLCFHNFFFVFTVLTAHLIMLYKTPPWYKVSHTGKGWPTVGMVTAQFANFRSFLRRFKLKTVRLWWFVGCSLRVPDILKKILWSLDLLTNLISQIVIPNLKWTNKYRCQSIKSC